mmetsp:Transcript_22669/g.35607  ORF Transcript_22669/g.35607 Transcript_22669/m.35607 type:complete len:129 (-) Transcript_22669:104-490(-)
MVHSATRDTKEHLKRADIVVAAIGQTEYIQAEWLKPGAIVIDVGINSKPDITKKRGYRLVGDVNFDDARQRCGYITPVPGGVGPMTVAMLLKNTVNLARHAAGLRPLPLLDCNSTECKSSYGATGACE